MKRPAGVILTTIVLGLCAGLELFTAAIVGIGAFAIGKAPTTPLFSAPPGSPGALPPHFLVIFAAAYAVFLLGLAAWVIVTLIGLLRLKNWARYSVLVIGGCMAALSLMMVFGMFVAATIMPVTASTAQLPAHTMQAAFLFEGVIFAIFAAIGVWWLVYFNLRATKAYFVPAFPVGYEPAYVLAPATFPALPGTPPPPPLYPTPAVYPPPGRFSKVPTAVLVIACLYLLSGVMTMAYIFLPFPGFIAGFILSPAATRVVFFTMGLVSLGLGAGLLRLDNWARIGIYALMGLGIVNAAVMATPWGRARFLDYNAQIYERMHLQGIGQMAMTFYNGPILIFSVVLGLIVCGVVVWILEQHRSVFVQASTSNDEPI